MNLLPVTMREVGMNRFRLGNQRCESFLVMPGSAKHYLESSVFSRGHAEGPRPPHGGFSSLPRPRRGSEGARPPLREPLILTADSRHRRCGPDLARRGGPSAAYAPPPTPPTT